MTSKAAEKIAVVADTESSANTASTNNSEYVDLDYVDLQISRIPEYGDDARWRLATHLSMFDNLPDRLSAAINNDLNSKADYLLSEEQRQAVDNFVIGYKLGSEQPEMPFPECQYAGVGLELKRAKKLGEKWRRGEWLPEIGHAQADLISDRLNRLSSQKKA